MAKMTLKQKRKALDKLASEILELENETALKIGKWVVSSLGFDSLKDFREHYRMLEEYFNETQTSDKGNNVEDVSGINQGFFGHPD